MGLISAAGLMVRRAAPQSMAGTMADGPSEFKGLGVMPG